MLGSAAAGTYATQRVAGHRAGHDHLGRPCVVIEVRRTGASLVAQRLENLEVLHAVECNVQSAEGSSRLPSATIMTCTSARGDVRDMFEEFSPELLGMMGPRPTDAECARTIARIAELMRAAGETRSEVGLWAELYVMLAARDPVQALAGWHASPSNLVDFEADGVRVEVKATLRPQRIHHFRLDQVRPPDGRAGHVVSLRLEVDDAGASIDDLSRELAAKCAGRPDLALKLAAMCQMVSPLERSRMRFSREKAGAALRVLPALSVPAPVPVAGVIDVSFTASIDGVPHEAWAALPAPFS
jgi:hypothetical protein